MKTAQAIHEPQKTVEKPVVHASVDVVHGDRHKKTPERSFYRRFWMQARRAIESGRACKWDSRGNRVVPQGGVDAVESEPAPSF